MAETNLFKPQVSSSGIGDKKQTDGQFVNPPEYPEMSGFDGSSKTGGKNDMTLQKTPSAKGGRV